MSTVLLPPPLRDADARNAVARDLDRTLLVEAGAGTGKTSALVERLAALVEGGVPPQRIAAITFTEAAASELRERARHRLQRAAPGALGSDVDSDTAALAFDDVAVSTLHAFAQRILVEHAHAAGLPAPFEVLDEVAASAWFAERWSGFLDELFRAPRHARAVRVLVASGVTTGDLAALAHAVRREWDRCRTGAPQPREVPRFDLAATRAAVDAACALAVTCTDPTDGLLARCRAAARALDRACAHADDLEQLEALLDPRAPSSFGPGNRGRSASWPGGSKPRMVELLAAAEAARARAIDAVTVAALQRIVGAIAEFVAHLADDRRARGELEFHDLLVFARDLVRDVPAVRAQLHAQYEVVLVDEFQDTDPIQMELAVLIATDARDVVSTPWHELPVEPGRIFLVGDPKQSIYRFRRADVGSYLALRDRLGERIELTTNFRSSPAIVDWVNTVFSQCMVADDAQVAYRPLDAAPGPAPDTPVRVLGGAWPATTDLGALRAQEADEIVAVVGDAVEQGWSVRDRDGSTRPARPSDVAVLVPTRHALAPLVDAFANVAIPTRVESETEVYATPEVEELTSILTAVAEPADDVAVVAALRSPAFACRDDELVEYAGAGGRWDFTQPPPGSLDPAQPVVVAMAALHSLHRAVRWESVGEAVDRVIRERRMYELALGGPHPRVAWRRLAFVADLAYLGAGASTTLRGFARWLRAQAAAGARSLETVVPDLDEAAVRILTAHGAKGLEFPIVILAGLGVQPSRSRPAVLHGPEGLEARVPGRGREALVTPGYETAWEREAAAAAAERVRLLYVATTRARDHLVVSMHHRVDQACAAATIAAATPPSAPRWAPAPPV